MILNFGLGIREIDLGDVAKRLPKSNFCQKNGRLRVLYEAYELAKSSLLTDSGEI